MKYKDILALRQQILDQYSKNSKLRNLSKQMAIEAKIEINGDTHIPIHLDNYEEEEGLRPMNPKGRAMYIASKILKETERKSNG